MHAPLGAGRAAPLVHLGRECVQVLGRECVQVRQVVLGLVGAHSSNGTTVKLPPTKRRLLSSSAATLSAPGLSFE